MKPPVLNLLILEDDEKDRSLLAEQLSRREDVFRPTWAGSAEEALSALGSELFHLVSLDQRIPLQSGKEPHYLDDTGIEAVLAACAAHQPIASGVVLTGYAAPERAVDAERHGLEYIRKEAKAIKEWGRSLSRIRSEYFDRVLVERGAARLPSPLARSVKNVRDQEHDRLRLLAARDLLENGIRLFAAVFGAVALSDDKLRSHSASILRLLYQSDRGNVDWKSSLFQLFDLMGNGETHELQRVHAEATRFFARGTAPLFRALDQLHELRNDLAHDTLQKAETYREIFDNHFMSLHCLLEASFFFAIHPILDKLELKGGPSGAVRYRADDLRGDALLPSRIDIESHARLLTGELVWCLMEDLTTVQAAFPLSPLLITHTDNESQQTGVYLLHDLKRCEYREMSTGRTFVLPEKRRFEVRKVLG